MQRVSSGRDTDLDCFFNLGAYKICNATQTLSIYTSILLLMTQALVSRIFVPGISNFVNASVRRSHPSRRVNMFCELQGAGAALGVGRWHGRNKRDDDERSKQVVMIAGDVMPA
jgi:hypothetical protein